jgi:hypothetical protein
MKLIRLQRYLIKYGMQTPFPMVEIRPVVTLLSPRYEPQDVIHMKDCKGQHRLQEFPHLRIVSAGAFFFNRICRCQRKKWVSIHVSM